MRLPGLVQSLLLPALVTAQPPARVEVTPEPTCSECRIELTKIATLGNPSDAALLTTRSTPARDSRGRYYAWSAARGQVAVYDSAGKFIRTIGRLGSGPDELPAPGAPISIGPGDSLHFFEGRAYRVWSPAYAYARRYPVPGPLIGRPLMVADGRVVFTTWITSGEGAGQPLHLLSPIGEVTKSFGSARPLDHRACSQCFFRALAVSSQPGTIWSAATGVYEIERWNLDGRLVATIANPRSAWLPQSVGERQRVGERNPDGRWARIGAIWEDEDGLLWVLGSTGKAAPVDPNRRGIGIVPERPIDEVNESSTIVLDVIDPIRKSIVASRTIKGALYSPVGPNVVYHKRDDADGYVYIDVFRVTLVRPRR